VEDGLAARTVAAYIDLNPVRAGIAEDPKELSIASKWHRLPLHLASRRDAISISANP
jgi:hypothetical protein